MWNQLSKLSKDVNLPPPPIRPPQAQDITRTMIHVHLNCNQLSLP